ncbi:hypothetical protein EV652_11371 [Kribbella steppae]|uniref:Glycosyl hydrolase family 95 catalytic domain-containing protein n=1 Tax=Kribbella steppae TaxID=2512223 RepID=A0A4R2H690_9ACTN|nr:hypothetical protein [Kribbella steppae]TCO19672.1 hypothetical protein EV652_11371 [Kribbella steppae]
MRWDRLRSKLEAMAAQWDDQAYRGAVSRTMPDTGLLGNGDVGVTSGGRVGAETFYLSKGDFWNAHPEPMPAALGGVTIEPVRQAADAAPDEVFRERLHILGPAIRTEMAMDGVRLALTTWLAADRNVLVTEVTSHEGPSVELMVSAFSGAELAQSAYTNSAGVEGGTLWAARATTPGGAWVSRAALATRVFGAEPTGEPMSADHAARQAFVLAPGATLRVVTAVAGGGRDCVHPERQAVADANSLDNGGLRHLRRRTTEWWAEYWSKSWVDLGDEVLERYYYPAQYFLGSSSRPGKLGPGLHGIWTTTDFPLFHGDYHLNYNAQAPYHGVYSSNRPDLALPFFAVIADYLPEARQRARHDLARVNPRYVAARFPTGGLPGGALFPVGIGPYGSTTDDVYLNQVSNILFTASQYVEYYDYTRDERFLRDEAYPVLRDAAEFFIHYLEWDADAGQYALWSGPHEGSWGRNSGPDIALLCQLLRLLVEREHGLPSSDPRWRHLLEHLPAVPTTCEAGQTVFALVDPGTMRGEDAREIRPGDNTVNLEFVHPAGRLGVESPVEQRRIAIDTVEVMNSWEQDNSFPKVFTQAARMGYPPERLISRFRAVIERRQGPNLRITDAWHGIEKSGAVEAINSMLVQSDSGVIRVFPVWPADRDASFHQLRQRGGFLVSAAQVDGVVKTVEITSTVGGLLRLRNPWPGCPIQQVVNRSTTDEVMSGNVVAFETVAGDQLLLTPGIT